MKPHSGQSAQIFINTQASVAGGLHIFIIARKPVIALYIITKFSVPAHSRQFKFTHNWGQHHRAARQKYSMQALWGSNRNEQQRRQVIQTRVDGRTEVSALNIEVLSARTLHAKIRFRILPTGPTGDCRRRTITLAKWAEILWNEWNPRHLPTTRRLTTSHSYTKLQTAYKI